MVKQIWMSRNTRQSRRYGLHILCGVLGIELLLLALIAGGTVLGFYMGWPARTTAAILCLGGTVLAVLLAAGLGRSSVRDAVMFFLTEDGGLFVVDARRLANYGGSVISHAAGLLETQQLLGQLVRSPNLPGGAEEILRVEAIKENHSHYALACQVRCPNHKTARRTYFLVKGMENQELLLHHLERREGCAAAPEIKENRKPFYILLSALTCSGFGVLCVLSHPAVARLPQSIYFPCLGAAFAALCCAVWFGIRQHRGE